MVSAKRLIPYIFLLLMFLSGCTATNENSDRDSVVKSSLDAYRVIGPGGGGGVLKPVISPFDENLVMVHCDMTGAYITYDGGRNWEIKNLWNVPDDYTFDPADSNTLYLATRGFQHSEDRGSGLSMLFRSDDRGKRWEIVYPDIRKIKVKIDRMQNSGLLPSEIIDGAFDGNIEKVAVDPADNKRIYMGMAPLTSYITSGAKQEKKDTSLLVLSTDRGNSWNEIARVPGKNIKAIIPGDMFDQAGTVIVITENSFVRIDEHKGGIRKFPLPVPDVITADYGGRGTDFIIYVQSEFGEGGAEGGMYKTTDLGQSWTRINNGLFKDVPDGMFPSFHEGLAVCRTRPEVVYISAVNPKRKVDGPVVHIYSIFKTEDAGNSWQAVLLSSTPDGYITGNFTGSWMEKSYDPGWGGSPINLGLAPGNPDVCYAGDNGRCYKTTDGGKTWEQCYSRNLPDGSFTTNGLDVTTCYGVHFDPFNENHMFICYTDIGLFHSFNAGKSWNHSITGIPRNWQNTCYDLVSDPAVRGKVWSVWANAHDLPRDKMFGDYGFEHYDGGVAVSTDNGNTWIGSSKGLPENSICTNILLDTASPVSSRRLYVGVFDRGIFRSNDGGKSWNKASNGLGDNLFAWEIRQDADGRLFALFSRGRRNSRTVDGAIYYSDDGAGTWKFLPLPRGVNGPHDLMTDPVNPEILFVSCWPETESGEDVHGGMLKSVDRGRSWKQVFDERVRVNSAGMDPENHNIIFINTFQNAAYRSDDAGENWKRIRGYRFKWGQRVIPDIHHRGMIYLTTYGGSVFYGPAEGIPGAEDDIINMPEGWW